MAAYHVARGEGRGKEGRDLAPDLTSGDATGVETQWRAGSVTSQLIKAVGSNPYGPSRGILGVHIVLLLLPLLLLLLLSVAVVVVLVSLRLVYNIQVPVC
jgi:hypothetical protein